MTEPALLVGIVDVEALVSSFLRAQPEVAALCEDRVYTDMPHERKYPLVLVSRIGGNFIINRPLWLDNCTLQLDTFGGTHRQAHQLASVCLSAMAQRMVAQHAAGCVTGVVVNQIIYNPEIDWIDEFGHARPRFTTTVSVLAHP